MHCVIIGFSGAVNQDPIKLFSEGKIKNCANINPYLVDAPTVLIESRGKSICGALPISYGSMPIDDGHLILSQEDVNALLAEHPANVKYIHEYIGGVELIQGKKRWCLWLVGVSPKELLSSKFIAERVEKTRQFRKSSNRPQTLALADTPMLFGEIRQLDSEMLVIPKVSSERRRYIPIAYISPEIIVNGSALIVPDATIYHFGILSSNVHNAWMRAVAGRLEMRYQYSNTVVYNNFPWPTPTDEQKAKIERTAQAILEARALYPDSSLADLYDEIAMPPELRHAHQDNDRAVWEAYGKAWDIKSESACVAHLMKLYQALTEG